MVIVQEINKLVKRLLSHEVVQVKLDDMLIQISMEDRGLVSMVTEVYEGSNFIPPSVRQATRDAHIGLASNYTHLTIDEPNFRIFLNYQGKLKDIDNHIFSEMLTDFAAQAIEWRLHLDDNDRKDHVYLPVR